MDKQEYIIINKTTLEKRIDDLEKKLSVLQDQFKECCKKRNASYTQILLDERYPNWRENKLWCLNQIALLKQILSQSTPLTTEIEKSFNAGERYGWDSQKSIGNIDEMREKINLQSLENYISNLKLNI